ncbi:MAG: DNA polymerase III delta' subunit [Candidatus Paceibacteria bacterium]
MSEIFEPLGHRPLIEGLWQALERGRLPHALLFEGPPGIGKFLAARWFAQGLHCAKRTANQGEWSGPCGTCGGCKRFAAGSHPDVYELDPAAEEMESIPVKAIAERERGVPTVCGFFALRAMEGGMRTVIVREFERAEVAAQNALLKTLEEPGQGALLILESSRPDLLLETIRSRCVTVRFEALSASDCSQVLRNNGDVDPRLIPWAQGSPGRALDLAREGAIEVRAILAQVLRGELDPLLATPQAQDARGDFAGKTPSAQGRARARAALDLLLAILRDGVRYLAGADPAQLAHGDLASLAEGNGVVWENALQQVMALRGEVELNLSTEGILDRALLTLQLSPATHA